jgi:hypothetical protein
MTSALRLAAILDEPRTGTSTPGAHTTSCTRIPGFFPGVKAAGAWR